MCTWDLVDGKCKENVKLPQVHTSIQVKCDATNNKNSLTPSTLLTIADVFHLCLRQAYHMSNCDDIRLFCNGYYAEILVMDPFSLEIIFSLSSKVKPDWISALHVSCRINFSNFSRAVCNFRLRHCFQVLRPSKRKDDVVLAITTTGTVKVWTLLGNENKYSDPIYENESKQIRCLNAITLNCCTQNQRTVLIVCTKYWQIYDAGDFTVLCSVISPSGERWLGGDFLAHDRVILWSDEGKGYLYRLPAK